MIENKVLSLAEDHYENFPVASFLFPKKIRKDIAIIYWFARTADDLADEGDVDDKERLKNIDDFEKEFTLALKKKSDNKYFLLLNQAIEKNNLSTKYFYDLISAFKQDVIKKRYKDFDEILNYCRRSANPIGRIILELNNIINDNANVLSDKICTALQLTNFYQDTIIDYKKGRIYYLSDEMKLFKATENMFELGEYNQQISALVKHNVDRAQSLFNEGRELLSYLKGRLKLEIKWTIAGGERILSKIRKNNYNVFFERPTISKSEYFIILGKSIFKND